ncbi:hypothetical protein Tco_0484934 [Tanacetum coccineum]
MKNCKKESTVQRDPMFDVMPEDNIDHMEADIAQSEGRTKELVDEDKELDEDRLSTEDKLVTDLRKSADDQVEGTEENNKGNEEIFESNFKHSELKSKKFEDIQAMYEKIKRSDEDFITIGSVADEKLIKKMNKKDSSKGEEIKQESKEEVKKEKDEEGTRKRKLEDLIAVNQLVMDKYQDEMPEGFERVLWGDLMVLFKPDEQERILDHSIHGM